MKAKEENGVAVSDVPENGQEDKKYWIREDIEASRSILRAVSSGVSGQLDYSGKEDVALVNRCSTEQLEAALTGKLTEVACGFDDVTDGCINQLHGDVVTVEFLMQSIESGTCPTEQAEALIHVCNRMVKSAKMIIEYETEKAAKSVPGMDDVRHNAKLIDRFVSPAKDDENEFLRSGRLSIIEYAAEKLGESAKNLADYNRRTVA